MCTGSTPVRQKAWSFQAGIQNINSTHQLLVRNMNLATCPKSFRIGKRVHSTNDTRRIGTVKYIGPVENYSGIWVGVDWDKDEEGKHDGSIQGVQYFLARSERSGSFVRIQNLSFGISLLQALKLRYKTDSTKEEEDEMYVLSTSNNHVSIQLLGKDKIQDKLSRFEELTGVSLSYLGVSSLEGPCDISTILANLKELDLTGNLVSQWQDVGTICGQLPALTALNLSNNLLEKDIKGLPHLENIRVLVLNNTGICWSQVEVLEHSLPVIEELHLIGNGITRIKPSSSAVQGFSSLRLLNLEDNCIAEWDEILKLSQLRSLEQLYLNKNRLTAIYYPDMDMIDGLLSGYEPCDKSYAPFQNLQCLLLGANNIDNPTSIDSLNSFFNLVDIRLSGNPIADPGRGGVPRFVMVARLAKVELLNGSEVSARERKESEIRYVRLVISKLSDNPEELKCIHPRFDELKKYHRMEDERPSAGVSGPQKMASGLISVTLKCVGASMGEKPPLTKRLPVTIMVGKLKILCESFFKLKSVKPKLYLEEEGSPLPTLLDDEMASLVDLGIGDNSTILIDEES